MFPNAWQKDAASTAAPLALAETPVDPEGPEAANGSTADRTDASGAFVTTSGGPTSRRQFNASEVGGNLVAAGLSNAYDGAAYRTVTGTLGRWALQVMWDAASNELKEFCPDIRRVLHR